MRTFRSLFVAVFGVLLFLYLKGLPDSDKPSWYLKLDEGIGRHVENKLTKFDSALTAELEKALKNDNGYELGPHKHLHLLNPPVAVNWTESRPAQFYDLAEFMPTWEAYYNINQFKTVYRAYGQFLRNIDTQKLAAMAGRETFAERLNQYTQLIVSGTSNSLLEDQLKREIQSEFETLRTEVHRKKQMESVELLGLYTRAMFDYAHPAYKTNVVNSEGDRWLRPSYTMNPSFSSWIENPPLARSHRVKGDANIEIYTSEESISGQQVIPATLTGNANITTSFKRIGKIEMLPGGWFHSEVIKEFQDGPFVSDKAMWGPKGEFPSIPVCLVLAQEPSVAFDVVGINKENLESASLKIGPLEFSQQDTVAQKNGDSITVVHNPKKVYLLAVITKEMPFVDE
jgi:hypothetical protein